MNITRRLQIDQPEFPGSHASKPNGARPTFLVHTFHAPVRIMASCAFVALAIVAIRFRWSAPALGAWAAALVVYGVGLVPALGVVGSTNFIDPPSFFASAILCSVATPLLTCISASYLVLSAPRRYAPLALGVWSFVLGVVPYPAMLRAWHLGRPALLMLCAVTFITAGAVLLSFARDLQRSLFEPRS